MKKIILTFFLFAGLTSLAHSQENNSNNNISFEYMTIIADYISGSLSSMAITKPGGSVETISGNTKMFQAPKPLNTTKIIDYLEKSSLEGWVVVSSNMTSFQEGRSQFYYLLKREKSAGNMKNIVQVLPQ